MHRNRRGFTILEAAIAVAIIGMTSIGVLRAFGAHVDGAELARDQLRALTLAQSTIARLRLATAAELALLPDSLRSGSFVAPMDSYRWQAASSVVSGEPDLYDVRVIVAGGRARVELHTRTWRAPSRVTSQ